jgi:LAGLIDADG endonuclease
MESLISYLDCGRITQSKSSMTHFVVSKLSDNLEKIIPFFNKYPLVGIKCQDFADFCKTAKIIKAKRHLGQQGLKEIKIIKERMNKGRVF